MPVVFYSSGEKQTSFGWVNGWVTRTLEDTIASEKCQGYVQPERFSMDALLFKAQAMPDYLQGREANLIRFGGWVVKHTSVNEKYKGHSQRGLKTNVRPFERQNLQMYGTTLLCSCRSATCSICMCLVDFRLQWLSEKCTSLPFE